MPLDQPAAAARNQDDLDDDETFASSRKRKFAPKTRLGCVNCKCLIAGLECFYNPPKAWVFAPKDETSSVGRSESSRTFSSSQRSLPPDDSPSPCDTATDSDGAQQRNLRSPPAQSPFKTQYEYKAFSSWYCFLISYCEPRSKFPGSTPDFWLELIPQVAYSSDALRYAMIASGITALSLARKEVGTVELRSRQRMLCYASRAIRALMSQSSSTLEIILTAWMFWQLSTMSGDLQSAIMHMSSATKIAQHAGTNQQSDIIAKSFIDGMTYNISQPLEREVGPADLVAAGQESDSIETRKRNAVDYLMASYPSLVACFKHTAESEVAEKTKILAVLDESRQEVQWILKKWLPLDEYVLWRAQADAVGVGVGGGGSNQSGGCTYAPKGLFSKVIGDVEDYLLGNDFQLEVWENWISGTSLMFFLSVIGTDLTLRHDMIDFMEFVKQIREPRRPTLDRSCSLPFNGHLFDPMVR